MAKKTPKVLEGEVISVTAIVPHQDLQKQSSPIVKKAQALVVITAEDYSSAGELLLDIKDLEKRIIGRFEDPKQKAHEAHKAITALEKELLSGPRQAKSVIEAKLAAWRNEQYKIEQEKQAKLQAQLEAEAKKEQEKEAAKLKKSGDAKGAKALLQQEIIVEAPKVESEIPKVEGLSVRRPWKGEVVDASLLPREYLMPDEKKINAVVRALGERAVIPGVKIYQESITVGR